MQLNVQECTSQIATSDVKQTIPLRIGEEL